MGSMAFFYGVGISLFGDTGILFLIVIGLASVIGWLIWQTGKYYESD